MAQSWWQYRQWHFALDMNRDGAVTGSDVWLWAQWLFYTPGDAAIALLGPTTLGSLLNLTPASFGSGTSAVLSAALWLVGIAALYYAWLFLLDVADPTYRRQRRERREAEARALRARRQIDRILARKRFTRRARPWLIFGLVVSLLAVLVLALLKDVR